MRIAVVDLLLHYPPKGGACVDLFSVFSLLKENHEVKLFCPRWPSGAFERGIFQEPPPLPVEAVEIHCASKEAIIEGLLAAVEAWRPELVFIADGWTLKPYLINAFRKRWPVVARLYAYECLCPRNNERWLSDGACSNHALADCGKCLSCAKDYYDEVRKRRGGADNALTEEMRLAGIFQGGYEEELRSALDGLPVIVYNSSVAKLLQDSGGAEPHVAPGGVDAAFFSPSQERSGRGSGVFEILVAGRMADPAKGASTALAAGLLLEANDFPFHMTMSKQAGSAGAAIPWLLECGWLDRTALRKLMWHADCTVIPSRWDEAFGMVWAEAMAAGLPVIASAVAGPKEYIADGENGLLFPPGDSAALAACIAKLAGDSALQKRLAANGLKTARESLGWSHAAKKLEEAVNKAFSSASLRKC